MSTYDCIILLCSEHLILNLAGNIIEGMLVSVENELITTCVLNSPAECTRLIY